MRIVKKNQFTWKVSTSPETVFLTNGSKDHATKEFSSQKQHCRRCHIYCKGAAMAQTTFLLSLQYSCRVYVAYFRNLHKGRKIWFKNHQKSQSQVRGRLKLLTWDFLLLESFWRIHEVTSLISHNSTSKLGNTYFHTLAKLERGKDSYKRHEFSSKDCVLF